MMTYLLLYLYSLSLTLTLGSISTKFPSKKVGKLEISPVGIGTWQWGNQFLWNYDSKNDDELNDTFDYLSSVDNIWFDTAEVYGKNSRSETLLGVFNKKLSAKVKRPIILTKGAPQPLRIGPEAMFKAGVDSCNRLQLPVLDLYQLHWPPSPFLWQEEAYVTGMVRFN